MPFNIRLIGNQESNEYRAATFLRDEFRKYFGKDLNCNILIVSNATLFGYGFKARDIDIIIIGNFERKKNPKIDNIYINDFCFVFELKTHPVEDIQFKDFVIKVKYKGKYHDVTTQSENQRYSLYNYFVASTGKSPYVCNFIWFNQVSSTELDILSGNSLNNYLPSEISVPLLFRKAFIQSKPYASYSGEMAFSCAKSIKEFDLESFQKYLDLFERTKQGISELTRSKLELITKKLLDNQDYAKAIGKKLVIVQGRAGTGKTIKIMRIACDLALRGGNRCLILTYNHALVGDIKRLFALSGIPDGIDTYSVNIMTIHKYIYELLLGFGLAHDSQGSNSKVISDFLDKYDVYLNELYSYIDNGLIQEKDIQDLMKNRHEQVAWDYVLIDEAQDWKENEKFVLFKIFGFEKIIVADGVDQLVRKQVKCNWERGKNEKVSSHKTFEKISLRQKQNLVSFVNSYARAFGINWELEVKKEMIGGHIIISAKEYDHVLHDREFEKCRNNGNSAFDMMFFVAPNLVVNKGIDKYGNKIREFSKTKDFQNMGIDIWDGTKTDLRTEYSIDINHHRLLQYDSCRGLEGWTVICYEFDEFIKYKNETFRIDDKERQLSLQSDDEQKRNFVYLWSLIPLTRAIDTIIITLKNKDSEFSRKLREIQLANKDFIEWVE